MGVEELVVGELEVPLGVGEVLGEVEGLDMAMQELPQAMVLVLLAAWVGMEMWLGVLVGHVLVKPLEVVATVGLAMAMGTVRMVMGPLQDMEHEAVAMEQAQVAMAAQWQEELVLGAMGEGDMGMHILLAMQITHGDQLEWTPTILLQQGQALRAVAAIAWGVEQQLRGLPLEQLAMGEVMAPLAGSHIEVLMHASGPTLLLVFALAS
jgi:hypothetical protein